MARSLLFAAALLGVLAVASAGNLTLLFGMSSTVQFEMLSTYNAAPVQKGHAFPYSLVVRNVHVPPHIAATRLRTIRAQ